MNRSGLLLTVAAVLGGTAVLMAIFGAVYNLLFLLAAVPFAGGAYVIWLDATGRLAERTRSRHPGWTRRTRTAADGAGRRRSRRRRRRPESPADTDRLDRREARRILGVDAEADDPTIRRAYRERVKEVHPDADGGSEEAFKRVTDAYERLGGERA